MKSKEEIQSKYQLYIKQLEELRKSILSLSGVQNKQLDEIRHSFVKVVEEEIAFSSTEMQQAVEGTVWDRLTIAFFGETNAGKSTIIEAFRIACDPQREPNNDGRIVGDGRSDFTQQYEEYNLEIGGKSFTLIDVPGIEGNEKVYADGIKKALRRAHIVFYVHGHNTRPNAATAEKIKEYLGDWVNVYTLYNVRASVSDYDEAEERESLRTTKVQEYERLIHATFSEVLGNVYKDNFTLQAFLAMSAYANFTSDREDLVRNQKKALSYFGDAQTLLAFSGFLEVQQFVASRTRNYLEEIVKANAQKMISMAHRSDRRLQELTTAQLENIQSFGDALNAFRRDVQTDFGTTKQAILRGARRSLDGHFHVLNDRIYGG